MHVVCQERGLYALSEVNIHLTGSRTSACLDPTSNCIHNHSHWQEEASGCCRHACEGSNHSGTPFVTVRYTELRNIRALLNRLAAEKWLTCEQHSSDEDIGHKAKHRKDHMSIDSIPSSDDLEECVRVRCLPL